MKLNASLNRKRPKSIRSFSRVDEQTKKQRELEQEKRGKYAVVLQ